MPPLFTDSPQITHGVYAQEVQAPADIVPVGSGVAVLCGQFPWGPSQKLTYPGSFGEMARMFAPAGMSRLGSAYLSVIRKAFPVLGIVRVADPTALAATGNLANAVPANIVAVAAKYTGSAGNSIVATVGPPSDGITGHWNLTVSVTDAVSGASTSELYVNNNVTGTGADVLPDLSQSTLLASATKSLAGTPAAGATTLSGGTDGTITSALYVGTPGGNDHGLALLEGDQTIRHVFTDDAGNSLRSAVNAGLKAHVDLMTDRIGYLSGPTGQAAADVVTDLANYRSERIAYCDPWTYVADDVTGALHLVPPTAWAASVAAQLAPSTSIAWKDDAVSGLLDGISALEFARGPSNLAQLDVAGACVLRTRDKGGFCFEAGLDTSATPGKQDLTRTAMLIFIAASVKQAWEPFVDAPNVPAYQQDLLNSLDAFLGVLKANGKSQNVAKLPYIREYVIRATSGTNSGASIANGDFTVAADVLIGSQMSRIYFAINAAANLTISVAA